MFSYSNAFFVKLYRTVKRPPPQPPIRIASIRHGRLDIAETLWRCDPQQDGNLRLGVLHEIGRSGRFAVSEVCVERQSRASLAAANFIPLR